MATATARSAPAHPAPARGIVPYWRLWYGLFGAPAIWSMQLIADYALVAHFCYPGDAPIGQPTFGGTRAVGIAIAVVALLVSIGALLVALASWRETREPAHRASTGRPRGEYGGADRSAGVNVLEVGEGRARFMALSGVFVSGIFIFAVLMTALPLVTMPLCTYH